jgi:hypothetical protein
MANPYRATTFAIDAAQLPRQVRIFTIAGFVSMSFAISVVALVLWVLNQELQIIPTESTFHLSAIGETPVSNYHLIVALVLIASIFGLTAFVLLVIARRNRRHNSQLRTQ